MSICVEISEALQKGKAKVVKELVQQALDEGVAPGTILNDGLLAAMDIVGDKFKNNEVYVPEVLIAARAMNNGMEVLKPKLSEAGVKSIGKVAIGTVKGDLHDIGKNLVRMMIEGKGIEVTDLGVDVAPQTFVDFLKEHPECGLVCLSALLTTTVPMIPTVIEAIKEAGLRDQVKIIVGGAPVTQAFADEVGADAYTPDAGSAAIKAAALLV